MKHNDEVVWVGTCNECGKRCYIDKRQAKRLAKQLDHSAHMSVYKCGVYWHIGHMPKVMIKKGRR